MVNLKLSGFIFGVLLFGIGLLFTAGFIQDMTSRYGVAVDTEQFNQTYTKVGAIQGIIDENQAKIQESNIQSASGILDILSFGAYTVILTVFKVPGLIASILTDTGTSLFGVALPSWFTVLIISSMSIAVVWIVIGTIFQRDL